VKELFLVATMLVIPVQSQETFKARLSPVPIDAAMRSQVTGRGIAFATLTGTKLSISGRFDGLQSSATTARLCQSKAAGVRGNAIADLTLSKSASGAITGSLDLSPEQADNLRKGHLYIQIQSEKAPDGNLWGWLLR